MKAMNKSSAVAGSPMKKWAIIGAVALLVALSLYAFGRYQGNAELNAQRTAYDAKLKSSADELAKAQAQGLAAQNRAYLMEARAALYRTATDLDSRNFGTANSHLQEAGAALGKVDKTGSDGAQLESLQRDIASKNINVAINLGSQRAQVLEFAKQLNALIPTDDMTPVTIAPDMNAPQATSAPVPAAEAPTTAPEMAAPAATDAPSISDSIDAQMNNSATNSAPAIGDNAVQ